MPPWFSKIFWASICWLIIIPEELEMIRLYVQGDKGVDSEVFVSKVAFEISTKIPFWVP